MFCCGSQREKEDIESLFRQEKQQSIRKASREQVEELSRHAQSTAGGGGGGIPPVWPFHGESTSEETSFNLFKFPTHSNRYGRLFETDLEKFKQLKHLDLLISFANITRVSRQIINIFSLKNSHFRGRFLDSFSQYFECLVK